MDKIRYKNRLGLLLLVLVSAGIGEIAIATQPDELVALREAAEQGDPKASHDLALTLLPGADSAEKQLEVVRLVERAADAQYVPAMIDLGEFYGRGTLVSQDLDKAIVILERAAELGSTDALVSIGALHLSGVDGQADFPEGIRYFRKAAELGSALAMGRLGLMYLQGIGVNQDSSAAFNWLSKAAEAGDGAGMTYLGALLLKGAEGVPAEPKTGVEWLEKAAAAGFVGAGFTLGNQYETGELLDKDLAAARRWFEVDAERAPNAAYRLGRLMVDDKTADKKAAVRWIEVGARGGVADAQYELSQILAKGELVDANHGLSSQWLRQAVNQGHLLAGMKWNRLQRERDGYGQIPDEQVALLQRAAAQGGSYSQAELGRIYSLGIGVERNSETSVRWWRSAAEKGVIVAMRELGEVLYDDKAQDVRLEGADWLRQAAELGDIDAQYLYALELLSGRVTAEDPAAAAHWFRRAAERGHVPSVAFFAWCLSMGRGVEKDAELALVWLSQIDNLPYRIARIFRDGEAGAPVDRSFSLLLTRQRLAQDNNRSFEGLLESLLDRASRKEKTTADEAFDRLSRVNRDIGPLAWRALVEQADDIVRSDTDRASQLIQRARERMALYYSEDHHLGVEIDLVEVGIGNEKHQWLGGVVKLEKALDRLDRHPETPVSAVIEVLQHLFFQLDLHREVVGQLDVMKRLAPLIGLRIGSDYEERISVLTEMGETLQKKGLAEKGREFLQRALDACLVCSEADRESIEDKIATPPEKLTNRADSLDSFEYRADYGDTKVQLQLAKWFSQGFVSNGTLVPPNPAEALYWLLRAQQEGTEDPDALQIRLRIESRISEDQRSLANARFSKFMSQQ
ncbi:MAG: tetratricopeptide repeat protein [Lysobacterales bacterium]